MRDVVVRPERLGEAGVEPWQRVTLPTRPSDVGNEVGDHWAGVAVMRIEGEVDVGVMRVRQRPTKYDSMERHLRTPELIVALDGAVLLPVSVDAESGDGPDIDRLRVLRVDQGSGVLLERGVWHAIPFPLDAPVNCLVVFRRNTASDDLEVKSLPAVVRVGGFSGEPEGGGAIT